FTMERGYIIESKRGGGGYIRIFRIEHQEEFELLDEIIQMIQPKIPQQAAIDVLERLEEREDISFREKALILSGLEREALEVMLPARDELRARILTSVLTTLKYINKG